MQQKNMTIKGISCNENSLHKNIRLPCRDMGFHSKPFFPFTFLLISNPFFFHLFYTSPITSLITILVSYQSLSFKIFYFTHMDFFSKNFSLLVFFQNLFISPHYYLSSIISLLCPRPYIRCVDNHVALFAFHNGYRDQTVPLPRRYGPRHLCRW